MDNITGILSVKDLLELINEGKGQEFDLPSDKYATLNGMLIALHGNIPPRDKTTEIAFGHLKFDFVKANRRRIERVIIHVEASPEITGK